MGYTHYWTTPSATVTEWQRIWPQLVSDTRIIVQAAKIHLTKDAEWGEDHEPEINMQNIHLNGSLDSNHEPFVLRPTATDFQCCKTARKEYDDVVTAILLRASQLAGDAIQVSSDGRWDAGEWDPAQVLVKKLWPLEEIHCPLRRERY